ncbi:hypothetical protein NLJ89_g1196 [Agrocybe chaxingu]|uniref:F-box domain-containing protein n=1 Tax=Agrocybe chaxingu TaxID=84603 RepID=A0A9W8TEU1_9AGAR|nr:hypothetical protein NLJ89_g1196 [Agrocybe chaxingu]
MPPSPCLFYSGTQQVTNTSPDLDADIFFQEFSARISHLHRPLVSPLEHLLYGMSRHCATPEENVQIRQVIGDIHGRMQEIACAASQIERLHKSLVDEHEKMEELSRKHLVLIAPVWKVPPEILSYIFTLSAPPSSLSELDEESSNPSLVLTHVNRYWRNVALSTPQLWTAIYIDAPTLQHELCVPKLLAERSGNYPLTVRAYHHRAYSEEIIEFLASLSPRWEHVALDLCVEMMEGLRGIQGRLPSLRSVELTSVVRWRYDTPRAHLGFFSNTPLLRHMAIASPFIPEFRALPWQQLTSYDGPVSVADIPRFFKLGHNLQECFIQPMRMSSNQTLYRPD